MKTFYGCASLITSDKVPMGKIPRQIDRYFAAYGPGAIAFYNGFHEDLEKMQAFRNVVLLDCSEATLDGRVKLCTETSSAPLDRSDARHLTDEEVQDVEVEREYTRVGRQRLV